MEGRVREDDDEEIQGKAKEGDEFFLIHPS